MNLLIISKKILRFLRIVMIILLKLNVSRETFDLSEYFIKNDILKFMFLYLSVLFYFNENHKKI